MQQHDTGRKKLDYSAYKRPMAMRIKVFIRFLMCLLKIAAPKTRYYISHLRKQGLKRSLFMHKSILLLLVHQQGQPQNHHR